MKNAYLVDPHPVGSHKAAAYQNTVWSGGDGEPLLMLAAVLGAGYERYRRRGRTPAPITGNALRRTAAKFRATGIAIDGLRELGRGEKHFRPKWWRNFILTKAQKLALYARTDPRKEQVESIWTRCKQMALMKIGILQ